MTYNSSQVYYLYVRFSNPGPSQSQIEHEVNTIIQQIESSGNLDFEGCKIKVDMGQIDSGSDFSRTDTAFITWLAILGIDDSLYDFGGKWFNTDNPSFSIVQLRWATKN